MDIGTKLTEIITKLDFDEYRMIDIDDVVFSEDVFSNCARNTCGNYNRNYACPPRSGTLSENIQRMKKYQKAIIVNKISPMKTREQFNNGLIARMQMIKDLRAESDKLDDVFVVGPGGCTVCEKCAAIDGLACRFPDKTQYSMEGSGIDIVKMSQQQNMTYNGGERGLGYFFLILYND